MFVRNTSPLPLLLLTLLLTSPILHVTRGQLFAENWVSVDIDPTAQTGSGTTPSLALDVENERVYVATMHGGFGNGVGLFICNSYGGFCVSRDLSGGVGGTGFSPSLALDTARRDVLVASRDAMGDRLVLTTCDRNGNQCSRRDVSGSMGDNSGSEPDLVLDVDNRRAYIVTTNGAASGTPWLTICDLDSEATPCSHHNISAGQGVNSGLEPSLALDLVHNKVYVATRHASMNNLVWLYICDLDGSNCISQDVSSSEPIGCGHTPSLAVDPVGGKVFIATENKGRASRLWLFICNLNGTDCASFDTTGSSSYSATNPSLAIKDGFVYVASTDSVDPAKVSITICNDDGSECTRREASADQGNNSGLTPSLGVDSVNGRIVVATRNSLANNRPFLYVTSPYSLPASSLSTVSVPQLTLGPSNPDMVLTLGNLTALMLPRDLPGSPVDFRVSVSTNTGPNQDVMVPYQPSGFPQIPITVATAFALYEVEVMVGNGAIIDPLITIDGRLDPSKCVLQDLPSSNTFSFQTETTAQVILSLAWLETNSSAVPGFEFSAIEDIVEVRLTAGEDSLNTSLIEMGPGLLDVAIAFSSPSALSYSLTIEVDSQPIPGSPFVVNFDLVCPPGTQASGLVCDLCPLTTYQPSVTTRSEPCLSCPFKMGGPIGSTSFLNCTCERGLWPGYGTRTNTSVCVPCPPGGFCEGGTTYPVAERGFFPRSTDDPYSFVTCVRSGCLRDGRCEEGYVQGYMCSQCAPGYYSASESECAECPTGASGRLAGALVVLAVVAVAVGVFVAWTSARVGERKGGSTTTSPEDVMAEFRMRTTPVSFGLILYACQVVGILAQANWEWSSESKAVLGVFSLFNIDSQSIAAECSLASFHTMYALSVLIPFLFLCFVIGVVVVARMCRRLVSFLSGLEHMGSRTLVDAVLFSLAPLLYIPIARASLILFDCSELPNGDIVLDVDNGVLCFDSAWWSVFPVGLVAVLAFVVGIPAYFGVTIWTHRHTLYERSVTSRFGSLYRHFRRKYYWGEIGNLGKRLAIVVVALFFSNRQLVQFGFLVTILLVSLVFGVSRQPYYVPLYNQVDARLTGVLVAILLLGAASYAERSSTGTDSLLLAGTIIAVLILVAVSVHALVADVMSLRKERQGTFVAAEERHARIAEYVLSELQDIGDDGVGDAARVFLQSLASRGGGRDSGGGVELDQV